MPFLADIRLPITNPPDFSGGFLLARQGVASVSHSAAAGRVFMRL
ncbi:hypothetical protein GGR20_002432 [Devosia subaequoris]|uniref:Uncharacterized protein n=1 Tax=Devosia subaequoris TaxID=395930 RepID=A0A7W6NCH6_9HYPH|nr:hypothetical protein [Devosia subaequoris]